MKLDKPSIESTNHALHAATRDTLPFGSIRAPGRASGHVLSGEEDATFDNTVRGLTVESITGAAGRMWWEDKTADSSELMGTAASISTVTDPMPCVYRYSSVVNQLPPLSSLTKTKPSAILPNNLLNILYVYAHTMRLFGGSFAEAEQDAAICITTASSVLAEDARHLTPVSALVSAQAGTQLPSVKAKLTSADGPAAQSLLLLSDVRMLIMSAGAHHRSTMLKATASTGHFVVDALLHMYEVFTLALKLQRAEAGARKALATLHQASQKLYFMLVWAHSYLLPEAGEGCVLEMAAGVTAYIDDVVTLHKTTDRKLNTGGASTA
jgi:hypothetical protein